MYIYIYNTGKTLHIVIKSILSKGLQLFTNYILLILESLMSCQDPDDWPIFFFWNYINRDRI
jgi:hypothetical protein